jgi:hypothetical protein
MLKIAQLWIYFNNELLMRPTKIVIRAPNSFEVTLTISSRTLATACDLSSKCFLRKRKLSDMYDSSKIEATNNA